MDKASELGKQISAYVQEALRSGDFTQLKSAIEDTAQELRHSVRRAWESAPAPSEAEPADKTVPPRPPSSPQTTRRTQADSRPVRTPAASVPGKTAGVLFTVFGAVGMGLCSLIYLGNLAGKLAWGRWTEALSVSIVMLPLIAVGAVLLRIGTGKLAVIRRYRRYDRILSGASYYMVDKLAAATAQSSAVVAKDLRRMIRQGFFQDAYMDEQGTCIMLNRETYDLYRSTMRGAAQRQAEQSHAAGADASGVIAEGQRYIARIRESNDAILDEELSQKLYRLEAITVKVFDYVERHPEKIPEIRRFINYYLPTTLKLVNAYREFDAQPVAGGKIAAAKNEIREVLDTINTAFARFLDELFADDVLDISADISALESVLAQDGLTGSEFGMKAGKE